MMISRRSTTAALADRVHREQEAHTVDDVLGESERLKRRFAAVFDAPHVMRMDASWERALDNVNGLRVLDYGCGRGELGLELCRRGALVTGVDISKVYVEDANRKAQANAFGPDRACFVTGDAHALQFGDDQFDLVVGSGILHHLEIRTAVDEIARVLKPGGMAIFKEPLMGAPWMWIFRALTPRARTADEQPLSEATLRRLDQQFQVKSTYYGLLVPPFAATISAVLPGPLLQPFLAGVDALDRLIGQTKLSRSWHQYVLLALQKPRGH